MIKRLTKIFTVINLMTVMLAFSTTVLADFGSLAKPIPPSPPIKQPKAQTKQLWNLQNADIQAVVDTISQLTGKNFVIDPRVQGRISLISAKPMTIEEMYKVFLSMLQVLNYAAIPAGKVIKIVPSMDAKGYGGILANDKHPGSGDQVVVRVVPINNVSAIQLVPILQPLILNSGSVSAYHPSNSLVLAGTASTINQLIEIIHNLDSNSGATAQVIHLKYADATKLAQVLQQLNAANSGQGKVNNTTIVADEAQNTLLLSGNTENRKKAVALIQELDAPSAAGGNNTAVIRLNYLTAKKVSEMLTKLAHGYVQQQKARRMSSNRYGVGSEGNENISIQPIEDDNAIVVSGPHQIVKNLKKVIKKIDVRPSQVLVQAIIVKVDESTMRQLGIQWGLSNLDSMSNNSKSLINSVMGAFASGIGFIKNGSFRALVTALHSSGNTDILATPSILVLNNQKASISDGKNIGILSRQNMTNVAGNNDSTVPFNNYQRMDVTLALNVTPQIAPDNTVKLTIDQQDDALSSDAQSASADNPAINTSKIKTTVMVDNGDILVLGGLISNNNTVTDQKIPLLGDIPLLGHLFHYTNTNVDKKNLMVFIRPVIINNKAQAKDRSMGQYDYIRYQQMRKRSGFGLNNADQFPVLPARSNSPLVKLPTPFD